MEFNEVFLSLQKLFPQIDERALKAVAIEHWKDVNAAVKSVLTEIIPNFIRKRTPNSPLNQSMYTPESSQDSADTHVEVSGEPVAEATNSGDKFLEKNVEILSAIIPEIANFVREVEDGKENDPSENKSDKLDESTMYQYSQANAVNVLEETIEEEKDKKKTLSAEMEAVIGLMKQVELKQQILEQAKYEAVLGGKNIMDKVEELKRMLQHAKQANEMHTGEVYGEKAILATELKELHSRVLSLSGERDKSLEVLDEMRQTLEVQLAATVKEIQSAELEKLKKENSARELLAHQELIMEKVVQESKILKQQSEDNAKLQEFLMDHGSVVDMLQGELSLICQDVRMLKEKFDERVPLSKSPFSSQTSFILASSESSPSSKSLVKDQIKPMHMGVDDLSPSSKSLVKDQIKPMYIGVDDLSETQKTNDDGLVCEHEKDSTGNWRALAAAEDGWEYFEHEISA